MSSEDNKIIDVPSEEVKDETTGGTPNNSSKPEGDDKFKEFTQKAADGTAKAIGSAYEKVKDIVAKGNFEPRKSIHILDKILDWAKEKFPPESFEAVSNWFAKYGHGGLVCAQVLAVVFFLISAIVTRTFSLVFVGLGYSVLLVILQYTADKFLSAGDTLIKSSPSRLSSKAFLNCLALIAEALGIIVLIKSIADWQMAGFIVGLGFWALCDAIAYIAINPSLANITIDEDTAAGEEAIGILSFVVKAVVRIVPFAFGIGAMLGSVAILAATLSLLFKGSEAFHLTAVLPVKFVVFCACLPFASYVVFALYHLIIDVLRAILVIPGKIDKLNDDLPRD